MITHILKTASDWMLHQAREWTADHLHVDRSSVSATVAVGYVCRHFEVGTYSGWDGFAEMLEADRKAGRGVAP